MVMKANSYEILNGFIVLLRSREVKLSPYAAAACGIIMFCKRFLLGIFAMFSFLFKELVCALRKQS